MFRPLLTAITAAIVIAAPASAAVQRAFDRAAFDAAKAAGGPVLVDVAAWWCPVCHSQDGTIKAAIADPRYAKLTIFTISYDRQKPDWQALGVRKQGTLIAFTGGHEVGRIEFQTDKAAINALLQSTVK
jgi:thioredoxin-like negative regulator of GroEL